MQDYLEGLKMITSINNDIDHLQNVVAPIVADWPGQLFIRKALTYLHSNNSLLNQTVPKEINCFYQFWVLYIYL